MQWIMEQLLAYILIPRLSEYPPDRNCAESLYYFILNKLPLPWIPRLAFLLWKTSLH